MTPGIPAQDAYDDFKRRKPGKPPNPRPESWTKQMARELDMPEHELWKQLRRSLGLSLRDVGRHCGVSHNQVWKWELGINYPPATQHARLLDLLSEAAG